MKEHGIGHWSSLNADPTAHKLWTVHKMITYTLLQLSGFYEDFKSKIFSKIMKISEIVGVLFVLQFE